MSILGRKRWRDVWRNRAAFIAVAVTIGLGVGGFVAARDAYLGLQSSFAKVYADERFADVVASGGASTAFASAATALPGSPLVTVRAQGDVPIRIGDHRLIGRMVTMPSTGQPEVNRLEVRSGSLSGGGVYVEYHLADHFGLRPGDSVDLLGEAGWQAEPVAAIVVSPEYLWPARSRQEVATDPEQFGVVFAPAPIAYAILPTTLVPQVALYAGDRAKSSALVSAARQLAATTGTDAVSADSQPSAEALATDVDGIGQYALLFPILFLTAAALGTYMMLSRLVRAQRATIGTLVACGLSPGRLSRHFLGLGLMCGSAGAVLGLALGYPVGDWFAGS
ncbi:MAG TPA: FtsX-like permease family protein, partial [Patescibacteria group bacterium]|nr:FtsX-like permease family protein [Patescibacteria group bacterium]